MDRENLQQFFVIPLSVVGIFVAVLAQLREKISPLILIIIVVILAINLIFAIIFFLTRNSRRRRIKKIQEILFTPLCIVPISLLLVMIIIIVFVPTFEERVDSVKKILEINYIESESSITLPPKIDGVDIEWKFCDNDPTVDEDMKTVMCRNETNAIDNTGMVTRGNMLVEVTPVATLTLNDAKAVKIFSKVTIPPTDKSRVSSVKDTLEIYYQKADNLITLSTEIDGVSINLKFCDNDPTVDEDMKTVMCRDETNAIDNNTGMVTRGDMFVEVTPVATLTLNDAKAVKIFTEIIIPPTDISRVNLAKDMLKKGYTECENEGNDNQYPTLPTNMLQNFQLPKVLNSVMIEWESNNEAIEIKEEIKIMRNDHDDMKVMLTAKLKKGKETDNLKFCYTVPRVRDIQWNDEDNKDRVPEVSLRDIAWGNEMFVAVGDAGTILTSTNGGSWTERGSGVTKNLQGVVLGDNKFVAVGDAGTILTSTDGIRWNPEEIDKNDENYFNLVDVAWGNGIFMAVADNLEVLTSSDGNLWEILSRNMPSFQIKEGFGYVAWDDSNLIKVDSSVFITGITSQRNDALMDVLITMNFSDTESSVTLRLSTWNQRIEHMHIFYFKDFAWNDQMVVTVGTNSKTGMIRTYSDNNNNDEWRYIPDRDKIPSLNSIVWTNDQWVAVGDKGAIVTSLDGYAWTPQNSPTTKKLRKVVWNGNQLVAVGDNGTILIGHHDQ